LKIINHIQLKILIKMVIKPYLEI